MENINLFLFGDPSMPLLRDKLLTSRLYPWVPVEGFLIVCYFASQPS